MATRNAMLVVEPDGCIRWASVSACRLLRLPEASLAGRAITDVLPELPMTPATSATSVAFATRQREAAPLALRGVDGRGRSRTLFVSFDVMHERDGAAIVLGLAQGCLPAAPVSDLDRYVAAVARKFDAIAISDAAGTLEYVNEAYERLTGFARAGVFGRHVFAFSGGRRGAAEFAALCVELDQGREVRGTYAATKCDGTAWYVEEAARPFVDAYGKVSHYVFTLRDATARVVDAARLEHLAHHDGLTGLPNRVLFEDRLQQSLAHAVRRGTGFTVLCIDIDRFKAVNDTLGHAAGDRLLRDVALHLQGTVRDEDTVARLGGDEFAVILAGTSRRGDVAAVIEALRAGGDGALRDDRSAPATLSIGAASFPFDAADATGLLHAADLAMYRAKRAGGNGYGFAGEGLATA